MGKVAHQRWISKLMCYDFVIAYKLGRENKAANTLSKTLDEAESLGELAAMVTFPHPYWVDELKLSYKESEDIQQIMQKLSSNVEVPRCYSLQQGILLKKGRIVIVPHSNIMGKVLQYIHVNPLVGHSVYLKTYQRAKRDFYWKDMKGDIKKLVRECDVCQAIKYETCAPADYYSPCQFLNKLGWLSQWILLRAFRNLRVMM